MQKRIWQIILVTGFLLLAVGVVQAGGWAVLTLNEWPTEVVAGEPFTIQFVVRQHGKEKLSNLEGRVTAVHPTTHQTFDFDFTGAGDGLHQATLTLPEPGVWQWKIDAFGAFTMPPLTVAENTAVTTIASPVSSPPVFSSFSPWQITGLVALVGGIMLLILGWRRPSRLIQGTAVAAIMVGMVIGFAMPADATETAVAQQNETADDAEMGETLFVAKGCITCHRHEEIAYPDIQTEMGPNLTSYPSSADFLRVWLKEPTAVKPKTEMPNLELKEYEIEALAAFLTNEK
jgi:cytochrome c2